MVFQNIDNYLYKNTQFCNSQYQNVNAHRRDKLKFQINRLTIAIASVEVNMFLSLCFEIPPFYPNLNQFNVASKRDTSRKYTFSLLIPAGATDRLHGRYTYI